jgi:hypothetical protein
MYIHCASKINQEPLKCVEGIRMSCCKQILVLCSAEFGYSCLSVTTNLVIST